LYVDYPHEPYGDIGPEAAINKSIPWFTQENDTRIVVCVANFPNLPYYGVLHYYLGSSYVSTHKVTNLSFPHIPAWMNILPLGVHHWRFPVILTELLPQPFPPTDPSFVAQIPTNYGDRLHQREGIKDYTKQELVLQDHYYCVLGFLTLVNTTVDLPRPEEVTEYECTSTECSPQIG
jgi:hypothetical protein